MSYLIDTDILIYAVKGYDTVLMQIKKNRDIPMSISLISYAELVYGAKKSQYPERNMITVARIRNIYPVVGLNIEIMEVFAGIKAKLVKEGTRIEDMDLLIAATALYMDMTLVTNNTKHFERIENLKIENWND